MHLVISERKLEHIFVLHIYGCNLKLCRSSNVIAIDTFISPRINCFQRAQIFLEIYEYPRWPADLPGQISFSWICCQGVCEGGPGAGGQANVRAQADLKLVWKSWRRLSSRLQLTCQSPVSQGLTTPLSHQSTSRPKESQVTPGLIAL